MKTIDSRRYAIAISALAILCATTRDSIWKYFAVLAVLVTAWFVVSLVRRKAGG